MKKFLKITFLLLICFSIVVGCSSKEEVKKSIEYEQLSNESLAKKISYDVVGREDYEKKDIFIDFKENGGIIELDILNIPSLTANKNKEKFLRDSSKVLRNWFTHDKNSTNLMINWHVTYRDVYGNLQTKNIMKVNIDRETYNKINWEHFKVENLPSIVTDYWVDEDYIQEGILTNVKK